MQGYRVQEISATQGKEFVRQHHYSHGSHNGPAGSYGLFDEDTLIGVCLFATPCSENVRGSIFGAEHRDRVSELHRLVVLDGTPKNTESWFVSRALKLFKEKKPGLWAVVSFADATEGHRGTIYQALNFLYYGTSGKARFYRDQDGRLRHPRQNGVNISVEDARDRGWEPVQRAGKHRYCLLLPDDKRHRKQIERLLRISRLPYPKG